MVKIKEVDILSITYVCDRIADCFDDNDIHTRLYALRFCIYVLVKAYLLRINDKDEEREFLSDFESFITEPLKEISLWVEERNNA